MTDNVKAGLSTQRRSLGGYVVEAGLTAAGYDVQVSGDVALVETARPHRAPYRVVLAQNAWNVIDPSTFRSLLRKYPTGKRIRYVLRRALAQFNLRRAERVVCLTEAMASLCEAYSRNVLVSPVTLPTDFLTRPVPRLDQIWATTALVPGTITWYKNSVQAIRILESLQSNEKSINRVVFAGADDGSGCWSAVKSAANDAGLDCTRVTLSREEMATACASTSVVLIPSELESLSLSLAEALLLAPMVIASDLAVHREVARRIGRQPLWLDSQGRVENDIVQPVPVARPESFCEEWKDLGRSLGLSGVSAS